MSDELFHRYGAYLRSRLGGPARKISIDAGFTCPNRDGTRGRGGCIFCNTDSFAPPSARALRPVRTQLEEGVRRLREAGRADRFLAYFQPYTNTYAPLDRLRALYEEALSVEGIAGLCIGTRPDCVDEPLLDLLGDLAGRTFVQLEYGLQSADDAMLRWMNRGHTAAAFAEAMALGRGRGLHLVGHMIAGLPGEERGGARRTADFLVETGVDGIKLHNLHVVRGTRLAAMHAECPLALPSLEEYAALAADVLERLPWRIVVHRLAGSAPRDALIAPSWSADANRARDAIDGELRRRGARQGSRVL